MVPVNSINKARFESWLKVLKKAHATAQVIVAVGHDEKIGQIHIVTTVERTDENIRDFLAEALRQIDEKISSKN